MPRSPDPSVAMRQEHQALRYRLLYGNWDRDLERRIGALIGSVRREAWGTPDLSANVFRSVMSQVSVLYDRGIGTISPDADTDEIEKIVKRSGLWELMQRVQRDTIGIREMFVRVAVVDGAPVYSPVHPHLTESLPMPNDPNTVGMYSEWSVWTDASGDQRWVKEVFDIRDFARPYWGFVDSHGRDVSPEFGRIDGLPISDGGAVGDSYPWRKSDGSPYMPVVCYHAAQTGRIYDPYEGRELVEGTLNVAVLWTFYAHCVRTASWPQRYAMGAHPAGADNESDLDTGRGARSSVVTDPAAVLLLEADEDFPGQPSIGQWSTGSDPAQLQSSISAYERRLAGFAGVSPSDLERTSGDPRSGYALAVSREGQREAQRRYTEQFRRGDVELLEKTAALLNRSTGTDYPEAGYFVTYEALPPLPDEQRANREQIEWEQDKGIISPIDAYLRVNPGASREVAVSSLIAARVDAALLDVMTADALADKGGGSAAPDMNIDQMREAKQIVIDVASNQIPRDAGVNMMVELIGLPLSVAEGVMGSAGLGPKK